jgi:hypothetical protein
MGLGLAAALSVASPAEAMDAVRKGTMRLAAERMATIGARVNDPASFELILLPTLASQGIGTIQYPRAAFDYFIIDGLSIGGSVGLSYFSAGAGSFGLAILPRVGYAFDLSPTFEFWPRGGVGLQFVDAGGGSSSSAVMTLEGMFLMEIVPHAKWEFGPFIDASFATGWPIELGATTGIAIEF